MDSQYTADPLLWPLRRHLSKPQWENLLVLVVALQLARTLVLRQVALYLVCVISTASGYRRLERLLSTDAAVFQPLQRAWVRLVLRLFAPGRGRVPLLMDGTWHRDRCRSLWVMLPVGGRDDLDNRINDAVDELDVTIREIRSTIFALQTPVQRGLRVSIFALIDGAREVLGFSPELHMDGPIDTLVSENTAEHLLAVLQEALSNVAQHAGASHVNITVEVGTDVVVRVTDNGKGIPTPHENGRGLHNIEQRAATMGGDLSVSGLESGGTIVEWRVPVTA